MHIKFSITDCNHGFIDNELKQARIISNLTGDSIELDLLNLSHSNEVVKFCQDSDIIATQRRIINKEVIDCLPKCKVVARYGVGLDNLDVDYLTSKGIRVVNFPTFCTEEVANHALAMILFAYRHLDSLIQNKDKLSEYWGKPDLVSGIKSSANTTVGIIGCGRIGSKVMERLLACGFNVIVYDPYMKHSTIASRVTVANSLDDLLRVSQIITLHCCLNKETFHLIDKNSIEKMPDGSCIVNTSRGQVVNQIDIENALINQKIRCAFLDVTDPEPFKYKDILGLYVTPHCAFYSQDSLFTLKESIVRDSLKAFYEIQNISNSWTESMRY